MHAFLIEDFVRFFFFFSRGKVQCVFIHHENVPPLYFVIFLHSKFFDHRNFDKESKLIYVLFVFYRLVVFFSSFFRLFYLNFGRRFLFLIFITQSKKKRYTNEPVTMQFSSQLNLPLNIYNVFVFFLHFFLLVLIIEVIRLFF